MDTPTISSAVTFDALQKFLTTLTAQLSEVKGLSVSCDLTEPHKIGYLTPKELGTYLDANRINILSKGSRIAVIRPGFDFDTGTITMFKLSLWLRGEYNYPTTADGFSKLRLMLSSY